MNKPATFLLLSVLTLFSMTASAAWAATKRTDTPKPQAGMPQELTIFFANDVRGEMEPCG